MLRLIIFAMAFCFFTNSVSGQACTDIRQFDFKNAIIRSNVQDENELTTLFNEANPSEFWFHMRNGIAFIPDTPSDIESQEWRAELVVDRVVHPDSSSWVRLLVIDETHLKGPGDWRYVTAFVCQKGRIEPLFKFSAEGITLKHLDAATLLLYQAIWAPTDAHCCPGRHREVLYGWDEHAHRYRRVSASAPSDGAQWELDEK
jgi:hypothetical protein